MEWKEIGCNKEEIISKEIEESAMDTVCIRGGLFFILCVHHHNAFYYIIAKENR